MKITIVISDVENGVRVQFMSDRGALVHRRQSPQPTLAELLGGKVQRFINALEAAQHQPPAPAPLPLSNGAHDGPQAVPIMVKSPLAEPEEPLVFVQNPDPDMVREAAALTVHETSKCCHSLADKIGAAGIPDHYVCRKCGQPCEVVI